MCHPPAAASDDGPMGALAWRGVVGGALLLAGLTAGLGASPSTRVVGEDLVPDPVDGAQGWRLRGDGGGVAEPSEEGVHLVSGPGQRAVAWYDVGPVGGHRRWRVRAHVRAPRPASVKVLAAATDGERRLWFGSYGFESDEWTDVELPVNAPLEGLDVSVGLRLRGEAGEAWLKRVELVPVAPRLGWHAGLLVLVAAWMGWWGMLVRRAGVLPGVVVLLIGAGVTMPRAWVDLVVGRWAGVRVLESPVALWVQKLGGHAGMFGMLGAVLAARFSPAMSLGVVVLLGVVSEALQLVSIARSASLVDVGLDVVGGAVGVGLVAWFRGRRG